MDLFSEEPRALQSASNDGMNCLGGSLKEMRDLVDMALSVRVLNLVTQGNNILEGLLNELRQLENPVVSVTKDLIVEGGGQLFSEFFGTTKAKRYGRKFTETWIKGNIRANRQTILQKYEGFVARWEDEVLNFLKQVSYPVPGIKAPGNSGSLTRRITRATRYKKLKTRLQHMILELQTMSKEGLAYNSSLPQVLPKPRFIDAQSELKTLETTLRRFIKRELSEVSIDWWQRVPTNIKNNAERKKSRSETMWPWYLPSSTNATDYLDFSDYKKIILEPANWQQVFCRFFGNQNFVDVRLGELEPIRNDIAHSRTPSDLAIQKMKIYCAEIRNCLKLT